MSNTHLYPLCIETAEGPRPATEEEIAELRIKKPTIYAKWNTRNRVLLGKKNIADGQSHNDAWTNAFQRYPDLEPKNKRSNKPYLVVSL